MNSNNNVHVIAVYTAKVAQYVLRMFALDKRSLALWRVLCGIVTIYDLLLRYPDIHNHYTDQGVLPRTLTLSNFQNQYWVTFHMISGTDFHMTVLVWIHMVIGFLLTVGYKTRTMTILNWLFVCSLQNRNYIVCHSGDTVHRVMLFWSIFLPLGEVFSIDSAFGSNKNRPRSRDYSRENMEVLGFPAMAFTIQVLVMYVTAHFHKSAPEWRVQGIATWMALQLDFFRTPLGALFSLSPAFLTFFVLIWQKWGVIIYFSPIFNQYFKAFSVFGYASMHIGFGMNLMLELFTWITIAAVLGLTPGWVWDLALKFLQDPKKPGVQIYYLKHCSCCSNIAHTVNILMLPKTKLIGAQSLPPMKDSTPFLGIAVIDEDKKMHAGVDAWLALSKSTPLLLPLRYILNRRFVRRCLFSMSRYLHYHRHPLEESQEDPSLPRKWEATNSPVYVAESQLHTSDTLDYSKPFFEEEAVNWHVVHQVASITEAVVSNIVCGFLLFLIVSWNFGNIGMHEYSTPHSLRPILFATQLDQYWGMFAPRPPDVMWWYNIEGELHDGRKAELSYDGALFSFVPNIPHTFDKPYSVHDSLGNHRWFKLFENGLNSHEYREELRLHFGRWLCREFNARNFDDDRVHKFAIHWMNERIDVVKQDSTRYPGPHQTLWNHLCYEK